MVQEQLQMQPAGQGCPMRLDPGTLVRDGRGIQTNPLNVKMVPPRILGELQDSHLAGSELPGQTS